MKIRLTLLTENNKPVELIKKYSEEDIKRVWERVLMLIADPETEEKVTVESVEILGD